MPEVSDAPPPTTWMHSHVFATSAAEMVTAEVILAAAEVAPVLMTLRMLLRMIFLMSQ